MDKRTDDSRYLITPRPDDLTISDLDAVELFDHWIVNVGSLFVPHPQFTPVTTAHVDITEALWPRLTSLVEKNFGCTEVSKC